MWESCGAEVVIEVEEIFSIFYRDAAASGAAPKFQVGGGYSKSSKCYKQIPFNALSTGFSVIQYNT